MCVLTYFWGISLPSLTVNVIYEGSIGGLTFATSLSQPLILTTGVVFPESFTYQSQTSLESLDSLKIPKKSSTSFSSL